MAELTPNEILSGEGCFSCLPYPILESLQTILLAKILLEIDPGADVTPNAILADGNCFTCLSIPQLIAIQTILLNKILDLGGTGGGGSGSVTNGVIDPVAAPTDPTQAAWYVNTAAGTAWVWPAGGAAWQQII